MLQNKEIITYEMPAFKITESWIKNVSFKESESLDLTFNIPTLEYTHNDNWIIEKIGNYNLARYLILTVSYEENLFFVENEEFNIWGDGNTLDQAFTSFENFFLYDLNSYLTTPLENMDIFARQELKKYKSILNI